jgi:hypothetical protein
VNTIEIRSPETGESLALELTDEELAIWTSDERERLDADSLDIWAEKIAPILKAALARLGPREPGPSARLLFERGDKNLTPRQAVEQMILHGEMVKERKQ